MLTYNRLANRRYGDGGWMLNESVECFLRQTHPAKELILVNDCPEHKIHFDHPQVKVVNLPYRVASLGEKVNYAASLAQGTLLCRWDDDDLYLPKRLEVQARLLEDHPYVTIEDHWFQPAPRRYVYDKSPGFFTAAFRRETFQQVDGYPPRGVGEDQAFERRLLDAGVPIYRHRVPITESLAVYRWANGADHVSAHGDNGYELAGKAPVTPAEHTIAPGWRGDYEKLLEQAMRQETKVRR
jgi:glycosyltransferase involved in cell wall biosynthesis